MTGSEEGVVVFSTGNVSQSNTKALVTTWGMAVKDRRLGWMGNIPLGTAPQKT